MQPLTTQHSARSTIKMTQRIASSMALVAFAVCLVGGLEAGNTFTTTVTRALVAISVPGPAEDAAQIGDEAIEALRAQYRDVRVVEEIRGKKLGGAKSITVAVSARRPSDDAELRVLVSVAAGEDRAYLVEVFAVPPGADRALAEAQALLNNLKFEG